MLAVWAEPFGWVCLTRLPRGYGVSTTAGLSATRLARQCIRLPLRRAYTNWDAPNPSDSGGVEDFAELVSSGSWNDVVIIVHPFFYLRMERRRRSRLDPRDYLFNHVANGVWCLRDQQ